ncbi:Abc transporter-like protein, partial [Globisporangium polare]
PEAPSQHRHRAALGAVDPAAGRAHVGSRLGVDAQRHELHRAALQRGQDGHLHDPPAVVARVRDVRQHRDPHGRRDRVLRSTLRDHPALWERGVRLSDVLEPGRVLHQPRERGLRGPRGHRQARGLVRLRVCGHQHLPDHRGGPHFHDQDQTNGTGASFRLAPVLRAHVPQHAQQHPQPGHLLGAPLHVLHALL